MICHFGELLGAGIGAPCIVFFIFLPQQQSIYCGYVSPFGRA